MIIPVVFLTWWLFPQSRNQKKKNFLSFFFFLFFFLFCFVFVFGKVAKLSLLKHFFFADNGECLLTGVDEVERLLIESGGEEVESGLM